MRTAKPGVAKRCGALLEIVFFREKAPAVSRQGQFVKRERAVRSRKPSMSEVLELGVGRKARPRR